MMGMSEAIRHTLNGESKRTTDKRVKGSEVFSPSLIRPVNPSLRITWTLRAVADLLRRATLDGTTRNAKSGCGALIRSR